MESLSSEIISSAQLDHDSIKSMHQLFVKYYEGSDLESFLHDLMKKNYILKIYNQSNVIVGFSTLLNYQTNYQGQKLQIIFSGDTIMADAYWGNSTLAFSWLKFAGFLKRSNPELPLYWFIIIKGHRTYRYLPIFSKNFYPNHKTATPLWEQGLIDQLAQEAFGDCYNTKNGIIHFPTSRGHLKATWAQIPEPLLKRPEIQFFKKKNPHYSKGDELVCLCELDEGNLKPLARRLFNT